jgi:hypothetical protein
MPSTAAVELLKPFGPPSGLVLIGGTAYLFDRHADRIVFVRGGKRRTVRLVGGQPFDCDCEDRRFRGRHCKHLEAAEAVVEGGG